jgi:hypothetical protein
MNLNTNSAFENLNKGPNRLNRHPIAKIQHLAGLTNIEASSRLGVSVRQYSRYLSGLASVPYGVAKLVEMGVFQSPVSNSGLVKEIMEFKIDRS